MKTSRLIMTSLIIAITALLTGLLLLRPVFFSEWSSYYDIYTGVLFLVLLILLVASLYHSYRGREKRERLRDFMFSLFGRGKSEEAVLKIRVVPLMHLLIFLILAPSALLVFYGLIISEFNWFLIFVNLSFWGALFLLFLFSILFSRLYVYEWGIRFRLNPIPFNEVSRIRLKPAWKLLIVNTHGGNWLIEQNWFLLSNSLGFVKVLKSLRPDFQIEYE